MSASDPVGGLQGEAPHREVQDERVEIRERWSFGPHAVAFIEALHDPTPTEPEPYEAYDSDGNPIYP